MTPTITITAPGRTIQFKMDLDLSVITDSHLWHYIGKNQVPEPEVVDVMVRALRPGDVAIDGGANIGFFTLLMAKLVGPYGSVMSYEPAALNKHALVKSMLLNNLDFSIYSSPLWSKVEKLTFFTCHDGGDSALFDPGRCVDQGEMCTTTLDEGLCTVSLPRLIKLDIEGSEQRALEGATRMLACHPPYIIAELNETALAKFDCTQQSLRALMVSHGYETFLLTASMGIPIHIPREAMIVPSQRNTNLLYATLEDVGKLWPEVYV